jgi:putative transposase
VALRGLHKPRDPDTIYAWLDRYARDGLPGLVQRPRRPRGFPPERGEELVATVRQAPETRGVDRARWRLGDLRDTLAWLRSYTLSGVSRALKRLKVSRQRGRLRLHSPDLAYDHKLRWVDRARSLAVVPARRLTFLYGAEMSFYRQPTLAPAFAPRKASPLAALAAGANTVYRVCGALDALTGQLTYVAHSKIGVINLQRFLRKLRRTYPDQALVLAWDNWPIHQHEAVLQTASDLEVHLLWLPTYAPWTNPIEKVWRKLRQELLHHHRHAERWPELRQRVRAWLDQFARPAPDLLRYCGLGPK